MNVVLVISDTFRYDNLSCYGPDPAQTPRLDGFARQSHVFTNAHLGSFPTIPNRLDVASGRFSFVDHEWCPLPADTVTLQQVLSASGVTTQLICDNPHMVEMGFNYERGFDGWEWIRGQETDRWQSLPRKVDVPDTVKNRSPWVIENYRRNTAWWKREEDRFAARTVQSACEWLERAATSCDKFFLQIELFDPHEPWDAPQKYLDLYDRDYEGPELIHPHYEFWRDVYSERELQRLRAGYLAEVSLVDHWFGLLLDKMEELGLTEDTAVIFTSDHGILLGEHDIIGKSRMPHEAGEKSYEAVRMYDEIRRTPLLIRLPGQTKPEKVSALVQSPDLMPTILEMEGLVATEDVGGESRVQALQCGVFYTSKWKYEPDKSHGKSMMPLMRGEATRLRDIAVSSNTLVHNAPILAKSAIVTEDGWCLQYAGAYEAVTQSGALYTTKLIDPSVRRCPTEPALFNLRDDPQELHDVIESNEPLAREIHGRYVRWLEEMGTPEQYLAGRRKFR